MTDSVPAFISELIRSANEIEKLSFYERGRLVDRAGRTIQDYRDQMTFAGTRGNDRRRDIVLDLAAVGMTPKAYDGAEVSAKLLEAVEVIKTLRVLVEAKEGVRNA